MRAETSADTAARAIAIRARRAGRSPVAALKRRLLVASIAEQLDTTPERLAAPAPPICPPDDQAGLARRALLGQRIADALGLPDAPREGSPRVPESLIIPDHIDELAATVKRAGGTMRLYGKSVTVDALREHAAGSATSRLTATVSGMHYTPGKLPTPRLTATVNPPLNKGTLGAVVVDGYDPPRHDGDPRPPVRRGRVRCTLCDQMGHARSNRKFHPMRSV